MKKQKQAGFTLLELLIVIAIIGILASVTIISYPSYMKKARLGNALRFSDNVRGSLQQDMVAWWKFDETSGTVAKDTWWNQLNGTVYGATWVPGIKNNALSFDGVNDWVDAGNNASLQITSAITLEVWVYQKGGATGQFAVIYGSSGGYDYGLVWHPTTKKMMLGLKINGTWADRAISLAIPFNTWVHIVGTYDGARAKIYRNGVLDDDRALTGNITITAGNSFRVGYAAATNHWWNGLIDEVKIFSAALPVAVIQQHYAQGLAAHQNLAVK